MAAKKTIDKDFKYLVIVESPAKSKTLTKILGKEFCQSSSRNNCIYSGDLHTAKLSLDNLEGTNNILLTAN